MTRSETDTPASERVQESRVTDARGALLFDRRRIAQADRLLLDPQHWAGRGRMEAARGGRGAVCFVRGEFGEAVIRHYRRGGLIGRVIRDRYLWTGEDANRAFREFRLLARLRELGLPVPAPLAAGYARAGLFYRADLMTMAIPDSRTLAQWLAAGRARISTGPAWAVCWRASTRPALSMPTSMRTTSCAMATVHCG